MHVKLSKVYVAGVILLWQNGFNEFETQTKEKKIKDFLYFKCYLWFTNTIWVNSGTVASE